MARKDGCFQRSLETADRDREIALYKQGRTYRQVAEHFSVSVSTVHDAVGRAMDAARRAAGEAVIDAEALKLDAMELAAWEVLRANHVHISEGRVVRDGGEPVVDDKPVLMAVDRLLRVAERRARLLGLDAPSKQTVTVITEDALTADLRRMEAELARFDARQDA